MKWRRVSDIARLHGWAKMEMETSFPAPDAAQSGDPQAPELAQSAAQAPHRRPARHEIDEILEEKLTRRSRWFLVKWAGYHPSWEAWRVHGEVGTALETCEPLKGLLGTEALASWEQS